MPIANVSRLIAAMMVVGFVGALIVESALAIDPVDGTADGPPNATTLNTKAHDVTIELTDGKTITGELTQLNPDHVGLRDDREIPTDEVASMSFPKVEGRDSTETSVSLINDSLIAARRVTFDGEWLVVDLPRQPDFKAAAEQVASVRFRAAHVSTDKAWLGLVSQDSAADRMVIRRDAERLDSIEGVIEAIENETVRFAIDGDAVEAPMSKLEGVIFHGSGNAGNSQDSRSDTIMVEDAYGGRWRTETITRDGSDFAIKSGSLKHRIPGDQVRSIRYGGSRVALANAERASSNWETPFQTRLPSLATDAFFLSSNPATGDLELPAGARIEFRVPEGMSRLAGSVGRPREVAFGGRVELVIRSGEKVLWQSRLDGAERQGFDLDITNVRRVAIEVTDGNDGNLGDVIRFMSTRFVR